MKCFGNLSHQHGVCTGLCCTPLQLHCIEMCLVLLTINVFFHPSLWRKLYPQRLRNCLYLLPVSESLWSVFSARLFTVVETGAFKMYLKVSFFLSYATYFLYWKVELRSCVSHLQVAVLMSSLSDSCRNLFPLCRRPTIWKKHKRQFNFSKGEIQWHRVIVPQTFSRRLLFKSTEALTMHFEFQQRGGHVRGGHVFAVGHTAVGPLAEQRCVGDEQDKAVRSAFRMHREAPRSLPKRAPVLHVLKKKTFIRPHMEMHWCKYSSRTNALQVHVS